MNNFNGIIDKTKYFTLTDSKSRATKVKNRTKGLSKDSTEDELRDAVKSFESYFVEQVIKQIHKSTKMFNNKDNTPMSQLKDMYMDNLYRDVASKIVDRSGERYTSSLVEQMKRNYGIKDINKDKTKKFNKKTDNKLNNSNKNKIV